MIIYKDFQHFIFSNNILITASGFVIGMTTYEYIQNNFKLSLPFYNYIGMLLIPYKNAIFGNKNFVILTVLKIIGKFIINTIIWIFTIILTFVLLEYFLNNTIIGLKSTIKENDEKDFIVSKKEAKKEDIIPIEQKLKDIKIKEEKEEIIAEKIIENKEKKKDDIILSKFTNDYMLL
jgi:uncharacterized membrane protein